MILKESRRHKRRVKALSFRSAASSREESAVCRQEADPSPITLAGMTKVNCTLNPMPIRQITIIGTGLIGGSLGLR